MKTVHFPEKYPLTVVDVLKTETTFTDAAQVVAYFEDKIKTTDKVVFIGTFNHYAHTQNIGGEIAPEIQSAFNVVFCFGHALPNPMVLAVRPRSIGIADLGDKFVVSFMDAPMKPANDAMQAWALGLRNRQN